MFKLAFAAALIAVANAVIEEKLAALNGWDYAALLNTAESPSFEQKDAQQFFMMDPQLMFSDPAVPSKGITLNFHMGGMFFVPTHVDHLNFKCKLDGIPVYNENFSVNQDVADQWTYVLPFDVPKIAPSSKYDVTFSALDSDSTSLFEIESIFHL